MNNLIKQILFLKVFRLDFIRIDVISYNGIMSRGQWKTTLSSDVKKSSRQEAVVEAIRVQERLNFPQNVRCLPLQYEFSRTTVDHVSFVK